MRQYPHIYLYQQDGPGSQDPSFELMDEIEDGAWENPYLSGQLADRLRHYEFKGVYDMVKQEDDYHFSKMPCHGRQKTVDATEVLFRRSPGGLVDREEGYYLTS